MAITLRKDNCLLNKFQIIKISESTQKIKLTIITVVKDDLKGLHDTINSMELLNSALIEIIVWINSSTSLLHDHENIAKTKANVVITGYDTGIFDAMNRALKFANGDFVLFLNARDRIIQPFNVGDISSACLVKTQYINYFGRLKLVNVSRTIKLGIPFCHQGMILPRRGYIYDSSYKYGADYLAFLNFALPWPLPVLSNGLIDYDTSGVSTVNRWDSDKWTASVIRYKFGFFYALFYLVISLLKLTIKRLYDLISIFWGK